MQNGKRNKRNSDTIPKARVYPQCKSNSNLKKLAISPDKFPPSSLQNSNFITRNISSNVLRSLSPLVPCNTGQILPLEYLHPPHPHRNPLGQQTPLPSRPRNRRMGILNDPNLQIHKIFSGRGPKPPWKNRRLDCF